jgi:hypothetical protein
MGRQLLAAAFGILLAVTVSEVGASRFCNPHTCAATIAGCESSEGCDTLSGHDAATCRNDCRQAVVDACASNSTVCAGSPSGAFID